jgi:hypothetical protein
MGRWRLVLHLEWRALGPGQRWYRLWEKNTGEWRERDLEVWDSVFYTFTMLVVMIWLCLR